MPRYLILALAGSSFILIGASNSAQVVSPDAVPMAPPGQTLAASAPSPADVPPEARGSTTQVPASGAPIRLEAGKGTLIRLPRPAGTVFIANPEADPLDLATDRAREAETDAKAIESEAVRRFVAALLHASKLDHSGRGEKVRHWIKAASEAFLAGERLPYAPDVTTGKKPRTTTS